MDDGSFIPVEAEKTGALPTATGHSKILHSQLRTTAQSASWLKLNSDLIGTSPPPTLRLPGTRFAASFEATDGLGSPRFP
jgi:hypothetical protein